MGDTITSWRIPTFVVGIENIFCKTFCVLYTANKGRIIKKIIMKEITLKFIVSKNGKKEEVLLDAVKLATGKSLLVINDEWDIDDVSIVK